MTKTGKKNVVVVGGGIAGLMAGLWIQSCGHQVTLIERAQSCGGLLGSFETDDGYLFDYGTHIPALTTHSTINKLMFGDDINIDWSDIPKLKKGNYFRGKLNTTSQFIDINELEGHEYRLALSELINTVTTDKGSQNLDDALNSHFGPFLTESVFKPLLRRIYKKSFSEISPTAHKFLEYSRVVAASSEASIELKRSPVYDAKISFKSFYEGGASDTYKYPRCGGTGIWVQSMADKLIRLGGQVLTETGIESISTTSKLLRLTNCREIFFDSLVWTGPIGILAKMVLPELETDRPDFVPTRCHHFVFNEKPLCDSHYVYMNDPHFLSFRTTLYPNITNQDDDFRVTVEAIDSDRTAEEQKNIVLQELQTAGIISSTAHVKSSSSAPLLNGFPEMTVSMTAQNELTIKQLEKFKYLLLGGRGASDAFFMGDVLLTLAKKMELYFGTPN